MSRQVIKLDRLDERLREAVKAFWATRARQDESQGQATGQRDRGGRAAVTGGAHVDGIVRLVADLLRENGVPATAIFTQRRSVDLPLYFRPHRDWDLVVVHRNRLVACMEFKSQVGSFGNNYNNRSQEAVGDGHDMLVAYREGLFAPSPKPWIGYVFLLQDADGSRSPVSVRERHFSVDPAFRGASYAKRYEITMLRLVREALYNAASLLLTAEGPPPTLLEPNQEIAFRPLMRSLIGHALAVTSD